jgi:hypothetical protein
MNEKPKRKVSRPFTEKQKKAMRRLKLVFAATMMLTMLVR